MNGKYNAGCGPVGGQLPSCNVKGYSDLLPAVPNECAQYANQAGKELCVTQAGGQALDAANTGIIPVTVTPQQATAFWGQLLTICVFETGTQDQVFNGEVVDVSIRGSSQFASQNVPLCGFNEAMPFLGIAWDMADATNPINLQIRVRSSGNVDVLVFVTGYAIR